MPLRFGTTGLPSPLDSMRELIITTCLSVVAQDNSGEVQIDFTDGTTSTADFVVGCDGIHSAIRSQYIVDQPQYSGRIAYRGLVPLDSIKALWPFSTYSVSWLGNDKHFLVYPISQNKFLNVVAFVSEHRSTLGDFKESWTATGDRQELANKFADFSETVRGIIDHMSAQPTKWMLNDRPELHQWTFAGGKVVLLGDAAHAVRPFMPLNIQESS